MILMPYVGSKERIFPIVKQLVKPDDFYIEAFAGGYSLGMTLLEEELVSNTLLNDLDYGIYNLWSQVKTKKFEFVDLVEEFLKIYDSKVSLLREDKVPEDEKKDILTKQMTDFANSNGDLGRGVLTYLLCKMNMGFSRKSIHSHYTYTNSVLSRVYEASFLIQDTSITNKSYQDLKEYDSTNSFWFLDPPYVETNNFNYYNEGVTFNHTELRDFVTGLQGRFFLTYDDTEYIRDLYKDFTITTIKVPSSLVKKGYTDELFITNFPIEIDNISTILLQKDKKEYTIYKPINEEDILTIEDLLKEKG